jgi:hypothetical protein
LPGERDAVFELTALARSPAKDPLALLLLDLSGNDQLGVAQLDVYVLAVDAWTARSATMHATG